MPTAQCENDPRAADSLRACRPGAAARDAIHTTRADDADAALGARLSFYAAALAEAERRARLFRTRREELEARLMRLPLSTEQAFARFGLLLGTLPPAAIFCRLAISVPRGGAAWMALLFIPMLLICALLGCAVAKRLGGRFDAYHHGRGSWNKTVLVALGYALIWAAATGTAGGLPFFVIGSAFGFACALPCALAAFSVFVPLHRLLARGGMIDARHLHPLAWGINLGIAALILSPHVIPY